VNIFAVFVNLRARESLRLEKKAFKCWKISVEQMILPAGPWLRASISISSPDASRQERAERHLRPFFVLARGTTMRFNVLGMFYI
jgi:hypothetical protein